MVDAHVIYVGISLLRLWAFGDASNLTRMPTFLCVSVNNGNHYKENR